MRLRKIISLIISILLWASFTTVISTATASAATFGAGFNSLGGPIGNWIVDGQRTYCIEISSAAPISASKGSTVVTSLTTNPVGYSGSRNAITTTSGLDLAKANWVLSNYGNTANNRQAAAVQLWIWTHLSYNEFVARGAGNYTTSWNYHLGWVPSSDRNAVVAKYQEIDNAVNQAVRQLPSQNPQLNMSKDILNLSAELRLENSAGWSGHIELTATTGEVSFIDGGTAMSVSGETTAQVSYIRSNDGEYEFTATANLTGWPAKIRVWNRPSTWQQRTVAAVPPETAADSITTSGADEAKFIPALSTSVVYGTEKELIRVGSYLADEVTLLTVEESMEWPKKSEQRLDIALRYSIYGPLDKHPELSEIIPADAPLFEKGEVDAGSSRTFIQKSKTRVTEPGWYTWVWEINSSDQRDEFRWLMPDAYRFQSPYGEAVETMLVAPQIELALSTQAEQSIHAPGGPLSDTVTVTTNNAPWALDSRGNPTELTLTGEVWEICDIEELPAPTITPPEDSRKIFEISIPITGPGEYVLSSQEGVKGSGCAGIGSWLVTVSADSDSTLTGINSPWVAEYPIVAAHPLFLPEESFKIAPPEFSSKTTEIVLLGNSSVDHLYVEGLINEEPYSQWQISEWQLHKFDFEQKITAEMCTKETIFASHDEPIQLAPGHFSGERVATSKQQQITEEGRYQWVALIENLESSEVVTHGCGVAQQQFLALAPPPKLAHSGQEMHPLVSGPWDELIALLGMTLGAGILIRRISW